MAKGPISQFIESNFLHFNAAALVDAAKGYEAHMNAGGKMMVTLAGAMSTAELGKSLAEMIRAGKVDIISCTGANLEEDVFNLVAHDHYKRVPHYRDLSPKDEWELLEQGFNRVTDTCIPEDEAIRRIEKHIFDLWKKADDNGESLLPHEFFYELLKSGVLKQYYQIDPAHSWLLAAAERNLPIIVPGWEDSTLGNIFASYCITGELKATTMKAGIEYMVFLAGWYQKNCSAPGIGFFQIGGGIAGLSAALEASKHGKVLLLTKGKIGETATEKAQGGIAAAIDQIRDSTEFHFEDTIAAGAGLCDETAVRILVTEGVERVKELIEMVFSQIKIIKAESFEAWRKEAKSLIIDPDDTEYLALSLSKNKIPIWSNDPHFKEQSVVPVFKTGQLVKYLKSLGLF